MPQVFKVGSYWVYFWSNESEPLEPIHVLFEKGKPKSKWDKSMDYDVWKMSACK